MATTEAYDDKGHSEERCVRCGWVMGQPPLNCLNDNTPHVFPSQLAEEAGLPAPSDAGLRVAFTVRAGTSTPPIGTPVSVPVEGGQDWLELGLIAAGQVERDGGVRLVVELNPGFLDAGLLL